MNRYKAKEIAEEITNEELKQMFNRAKSEIKNWDAVSSINPSLTKGSAWNILTKGFDIDRTIHILAKINMIREFGEFLPEKYRPTKKKKTEITPQHQEPIFDYLKKD